MLITLKCNVDDGIISFVISRETATLPLLRAQSE